MFNGGSDVSSKRVNGTMCIVTVLYAFIHFVYKNQPIDPDVISLLKVILFSGLTLLGVSVLEKLIK